MALSDVLRERVSRRGRSAAVECGELGLLTLEALPVRECAALLRGPGGGRAVLYAACRELQAEGEALRRAGKLFRPDEIMDFVSEEEIAAAVQTVLTLSGQGGQAAGAENRVEAASETVLGIDGGRAEQPGGAEANGRVAPETGGGTESGAPRAAGDGLPRNVLERTRELSGAADGGDLSAVRPEAVQAFEKQIREIRPEIVREAGMDSAVFPAEERTERPASVREAVKQSPEIRPETVQNPEMDWATAPLLEAAGQVSREFAEEQNTSKMGLSELSGGQKPQIMVGTSLGGPQNLGDADSPRSVSENAAMAEREYPEEQAPEHLHEMKSDIMETELPTVHESESEFLEVRQKNLHETTSDFGRAEPGKLHEIESEFSERVHERKSDFAEKRREMMHETESELAEKVARRLLEGLRRAAAVR